jgi:hypothetical protein
MWKSEFPGKATPRSMAEALTRMKKTAIVEQLKEANLL